MSERKIINVGSRNSQLALIQTNKVIAILQEHNVNVKFNIVSMTTTGDKILDTALSKIGEKSLFTKELELALINKEVDFVVHSLKDLPTELPDKLVIGAICMRDNPSDALIVRKDLSFKNLKELPNGSRIGTSSLRRAAQLKRKYSDLKFQDIRGNLNTRLKKLDDLNEYDALILAAAGIDRMQWSHRITQILDPDDCMYAVGQGAIAVECRIEDKDILTLLKYINHIDTSLMCTSERSFLRKLEGGCSVPVAVKSEILDGELFLNGGVFSIDGTEVVLGRDSINLSTLSHKKEKVNNYVAIYVHPEYSIKMKLAVELGNKLAQKLINEGADGILKIAKQQTVDQIASQKDIKEKQKYADIIK